MSRPYERWPELWAAFMPLDPQAPYEAADEEGRINEELSQASNEDLACALQQWHEAFDGADDATVEDIVADFNPSYDPTAKFGGYRGWAEWVRAHLDRELGERRASC